MTCRDFATRVLFSTSLEEKLAPPPAGMLDVDRGSPLTGTMSQPGRPENLRMAERGERTAFPSQYDLENEGPRAVLLHFFANHELLAAELMALALLRFPDAPAAFRRGLLHTLQEEQEHTRLYMERMNRAGLAFGSLPVNGFFWRHVGDMESPLDYVSRLSLTFEQANLDYARHYSHVFADVGDGDTAALLDRIYKDEITHVGYGLRWFRRWKPGGTSDWDAWRNVLRFPLSPARARGNAIPFNKEGRLKAGLHPDFISALEVFSQSRGRTPDVFLFNPGAEICALTNNPEAGADEAATAALRADLDIIPALLAVHDDVVLVEQVPSPEHLHAWKSAGLPVAEFMPLKEQGKLQQRKLGRLRPWGWSPDSISLLGSLAGNTKLTGCPPWSESLRQLFAKTTGADFLRNPELPGAGLAGIICHHAGEISAAVSEWQMAGYGTAALKAPWSLAGRGLLRVRSPQPAPHELAWISKTLAAQGSVVVEPWLDRVLDFSAQYEVALNEKPVLRGMVRLHNDAAGRFTGCETASSFTRLLAGEAVRFFHENNVDDCYRHRIPALLSRLLGGTGFQGCLGIDALLHRDLAGRLALRSVVEINPRCTMGRITLALTPHVRPGLALAFRIHHGRDFAAAGCGTPAAFAATLPQLETTIHQDRTVITGGTLCLNDPATARKFLATLSVGLPYWKLRAQSSHL